MPDHARRTGVVIGKTRSSACEGQRKAFGRKPAREQGCVCNSMHAYMRLNSIVDTLICWVCAGHVHEHEPASMTLLHMRFLRSGLSCLCPCTFGRSNSQTWCLCASLTPHASKFCLTSRCLFLCCFESGSPAKHLSPRTLERQKMTRRFASLRPRNCMLFQIFKARAHISR